MRNRNSECDCWTADDTWLDDTGPGYYDEDPNTVSWDDFKRKK